jgi:ArsR family transcriptional regulator
MIAKSDGPVLAHDNAAILLKALADGTRLKIVEMLSGGELCACKILEAFSITQPTLSYHMKILTESGLVTGRKDGAWMRYTLDEKAFSGLKKFLAGVKGGKGNAPQRGER